MLNQFTLQNNLDEAVAIQIIQMRSLTTPTSNTLPRKYKSGIDLFSFLKKCFILENSVLTHSSIQFWSLERINGDSFIAVWAEFNCASFVYKNREKR